MDNTTNNRVFAILDNGDVSYSVYSKKIIDFVKKHSLNGKIVVFSYVGDEFPDDDVVGVKLEKNNSAAFYNDAIEWLKKNYAGKGVKAHVLQNNIEFLKDPKAFLVEIERMMEMLDYDVWFNTTTDTCNYVFTKYDCRFSVAINECEFQQIYDKTVLWTSHSNPNYAIVDLDKFKSLEDNGALFDDRFEIPMFYIIKYLAKRKMAHCGFMNYYPTIHEEHGTFKTFEIGRNENFTQMQMQQEDEMFRSMQLNHEPNGNPEEVMDFMVEKLSRFKK